MLTYVVGDLFQSPAKVLVNTVNTVGVMGKGIAKDFKTFFPEMFIGYQRLSEQKRIDIGKLYLWRGPYKWVLNFPTKKHWRYPSKPEYIEAGLKKFVAGYAHYSFSSVAFPQLGCGHGELDWEEQVQPLMERYLSNLPIDVFIHLYRKDPFALEHKDIEETKRWLRSEPESLAFAEVWEDLLDVLSRRPSFTMLGTETRFGVRHTTHPEEGLVFTDGEDLFVPQDALLDAWQHLRSVGFLTPEGLTQGLDLHAGKVMTLLAELPYLKLANVAAQRDGATKKFALAIQLVPRAAAQSIFQPHPSELVPA
jgi:O-acetyl-ADP-ribose deacetylase (regulator of RNase III)